MLKECDARDTIVQKHFVETNLTSEKEITGDAVLFARKLSPFAPQLYINLQCEIHAQAQIAQHLI